MASIDGGGNDDQGELGGSAPSGEEELLAYVECLREQGLDIPDPEVDADGNLILDPEALIPGEEGEAPSQAEIDAFAEEMQAAQEVCGSPPEGAVGGFDHGGDQADFQDALVVFARCMRAEGFDVADPDFSSPDWQARFFSEFHSLEGEPAFETCQQEAFGPLGGGG